MDKVLKKKIIKYAKRFYIKDSTGHDWYHVKRVLRMARYIGKIEGADIDILEAAALLHDIGISQEIGEGVDHAETSAKMANVFLRDIGFDLNKLDRVVESIRYHRYGGKIHPESLEGKILQDADRLDTLGAIGVARAFAYGGARGAPIYNPNEKVGEYNPFKVKSTTTHFQEKLLSVKDNLNTSTAKRIGEKRHKFMVTFLEELYNEINYRTQKKGE
jgi:uncharacterized protein